MSWSEGNYSQEKENNVINSKCSVILIKANPQVQCP